jgi:LAS superfamily LD-carboxypeptidase LdcB
MYQSKLMRAALLLAVVVLLPIYAFAVEVDWSYPLPANLLENKNGHLTLVSKESLLPESFTPNNLVPLSLPGVSGPHELRKEAAEALAALFSAAEAAGLKLFVKSSYRSYQTQNTMYQNRLERYGRDDGVVAFPGSSDHQTGLGIDVLNRDWANREGMTPDFGDTAEAKWMEQNCASFGFIIRYLPEKQDITGIIYEPWHLRFVGLEPAKYIMEKRLSLEEFTGEYRSAIVAYDVGGGDFLELIRQLTAPPPAVILDRADEEGDSEISLSYSTP